MGLNGYAYANGNPVNLVDPSGMIGERPDWWSSCVGSNLGESSTFTRFQLTGVSNQTPNPVLSAVLIELGSNCNPDGAKCNCSNKDANGTEIPFPLSLGTITQWGIWTHDHHAYKDPNTGAETYATNAEESLRNIQKYDCVEFRGSRGSASLLSKDISVNYIRSDSRTGSLLINPTFNLGAIGDNAPEGSIVPKFGQRVQFVFIRDNNKVCKDRGCLHSDLAFSEAAISGYKNEELYVPDGFLGLQRKLISTKFVGMGFTVAGQESAERGDSGAGVYFNGQLIGVIQGGYKPILGYHQISFGSIGFGVPVS